MDIEFLKVLQNNPNLEINNSATQILQPSSILKSNLLNFVHSAILQIHYTFNTQKNTVKNH